MNARKLFSLIIISLLASCGQNVREEQEAVAIATQEKRAAETLETSTVNLEARQDEIILRGEAPETAPVGSYVLIANGDLLKMTVNGWVFVLRIHQTCRNLIKAPGIPSLSLGQVGDCYLNVNSGNLRIKEKYGPSSYQWVLLYRLWTQQRERVVTQPIVTPVESEVEETEDVVVVTGEKGDKGERGDRGPRGQAGRDGLDGNNMLSFFGMPNNEDGIDGDHALDLTNGKLYRKEGGVWVFLVQIEIKKNGEEVVVERTEERNPDEYLELPELPELPIDVVVVEPTQPADDQPMCKGLSSSHRSFFTRMSQTELTITGDLESRLPYKKLSNAHSRVKLDTLFGFEKNYDLGGIPVVKDAQVVFGFNIPEEVMQFKEQDVLNSSIYLDIDIEKYSFDESTIQTEQLCLSAGSKSACSGKLLEGDWLDVKREEFYSSGKGLLNSQFTDDLFASSIDSALVVQDRLVYKLQKVYDLKSLLDLKVKDLIELKESGIDNVFLVLTDDITVKNRPKMFIRTEPCR